ncbi:hypothetical protein D9M09_14705 [Janthinobacterium agaricidamnosum]|uniref:DUF6651 domain-containing protein n=1 Tax=Janthinobacterium agaricidamnosum TaxID=55508 RepID=A0A3G2EAP9_9BURK|nr:DUF6651 domain-containing protein [Janthinobacterium agaricidamnosum]AYM76910.1 hypothetical protein D9M09_14705 [Janthinobacterium agaricidamnosum]
MPFKYDANGNIAMDADKKPIFINTDGAEAPFDADATVATIGRLNGEAKAHRIAKETAEAALKPFKDAGIEDAAAAAQAITLAKNIKDGDLVTAGKVQEIKDAATRTAQEQVANATRAAEEKQRALTEQNEKLTQNLNNHIIGGSFASSKFISEKLAIPADIAQKVFGDRFKVDNGKLVPMGPDGNPIFSATRHGEHADFEEALQVMVGQYANKDMILKGSGASGGGAQGGGAGGTGGKSITRAQFDAMPPMERQAAMKGGATVTE